MSSFLVQLVSAAGLFAPMNARVAIPSITLSVLDWQDAAPASAETAVEESVRHVHHERDFGVGYGNSSGYASDRHYTSEWMPDRFGFF
ncbi:MAG TPA: hypothetical protein VIT90_10700 [Lysobacter sp.]